MSDSSKTTLIFDFDGTIADELEPVMQILLHLLARYGRSEPSAAECEDLRGCTAQEVCKRMGISLFELPFIARYVQDQLRKLSATLQPIAGIKDALFELKHQGHEMSIITSNNYDNVVDFLERHKLNVFEDIHTGSALFGKAKIIQSFLKKHRVDPTRAFYIGDEIRDVQAAKKVGVPVVAVTWGFNSRKGLERFAPNFIVDHASELLKVFSV